jgi:hypothetical protein
MKRTSRWLFVLPGLVFLTLLGCSGGSGSSITGVVTLDGQPLPDAEVEFIPFDRSQGLGSDLVRTDSAGRFEIKPHPRKAGLKPGKYSVMVSKWIDPKTKQPLAPEDVGMQKAAGTAANIVPLKYNKARPFAAERGNQGGDERSGNSRRQNQVMQPVAADRARGPRHDAARGRSLLRGEPSRTARLPAGPAFGATAPVPPSIRKILSARNIGKIASHGRSFWLPRDRTSG